MEIRDLRVGNKIQDNNGFIFDVVSIHDDGTVYCDFEGNEGDVWEFDKNNPCQGIELTEEILLKCGFLNWNGYYSKSHIKYEEENIILNFWSDDSYIIKGIKHLHQLQNLYWCLTNEELNVTL